MSVCRLCASPVSVYFTTAIEKMRRISGEFLNEWCPATLKESKSVYAIQLCEVKTTMLQVSELQQQLTPHY
jgi:hypothetical protein